MTVRPRDIQRLMRGVEPPDPVRWAAVLVLQARHDAYPARDVKLMAFQHQSVSDFCLHDQSLRWPANAAPRFTVSLTCARPVGTLDPYARVLTGEGHRTAGRMALNPVRR